MFNYPKWKIALIGIITVTGLFFCVPNFLSKTQQEKLPEWWQPMTLGLDLQGGSQLLLQVDLDQVVTDQLNGILDAARSNLREKSIRYTGLAVADGALNVKIVKDEQIARAKELLRKIDKGIYGTCEYCRKPIGKKRMKALPFARYCINCQHTNEFHRG